MRILLVDDEEHLLRAMARLFRRQPGYSTVGVLSASEALVELGRSHFDAAIVDHHLIDGFSGVDLLEIIGQRWPHMRRVLCSGGALSAEDEPSPDCADVLLMKPASLDEILGALESAPLGESLASVG